MKQAKARVRQRLGLPPQVEKPAEEENLYDVTDKKKEKEEEAARKKAEIEKQKDRERQKHVRPWDKNKVSSKRRESSSDSDEGEVEWKPRREHHLMSQGDFLMNLFASCPCVVICLRFDDLITLFLSHQMNGMRSSDWNENKSLHRLELILLDPLRL